jgi:hypothetical protein
MRRTRKEVRRIARTMIRERRRVWLHQVAGEMRETSFSD